MVFNVAVDQKQTINMMGYEGFILQREQKGSKENLAIHFSASYHKIPFKIVSNYKEVPSSWIPVGSVEWVEKILGKHFIPNYYPDFLKDYLNRKVWQTNEWPLGKIVFIKPADKCKRFTGFITNGGYRKKKKSPYWCSEVVKFDNEWRYYIANGKVLTGEWYAGDEVSCPDAPSLDIVFPSDFCGAVDMGLIGDKMTLVEANEPFSCGWYGKNHDLYTRWIVEGWADLQKRFENS
jgi:hypothetical protein